MKTNIATKAALTVLALAATLAPAQGPRGPHPSPAAGNGSGLDLNQTRTIEGTVSAVQAAYGAQYPSIQIQQTVIKIAPTWYLLDHDFEIRTGDRLKVTAAPGLRASDPYLSALSLTNLATGATLALRDASGVPLWTMPEDRRPPAGTAPGTCGGGALAVSTVAGVVAGTASGAGIQMPALALKTSDGKLLNIKIGPERLLLAADFEIQPGDALTVRIAETCTGETVALALTNAAGQTLTLRHDNGTPAW